MKKYISLFLVVQTRPRKGSFPVPCVQARLDVHIVCISLHLAIPKRLIMVMFISLSLTVQARLTVRCIGIIKKNYILMCISMHLAIQVRLNVMCISPALAVQARLTQCTLPCICLFKQN